MASFIHYSVWSIPITFPFYSNSNEKKNSCPGAQNNDWSKYLSILSIFVPSWFYALLKIYDSSTCLNGSSRGRILWMSPKILGSCFSKWICKTLSCSDYLYLFFHGFMPRWRSIIHLLWGTHWWMSPVGKRGGECCWVENRLRKKITSFWSGFWPKRFSHTFYPNRHIHIHISVTSCNSDYMSV